MQNLIGLELLTAQSSGLAFIGDTPNQNGDFLPDWLYFEKYASCLLCCARRTPAAPAALFPATLASSKALQSVASATLMPLIASGQGC